MGQISKLDKQIQVWLVALILGFLVLPIDLLGQDKEPKNWELTGYQKMLNSFFVFNNSWPEGEFPNLTFVDTFLQDNLLHNRLNFRWYISDQFTFRSDLRTRLFFGQLVQATPGFANQVDDANNDYFDLSWVIMRSRSAVLHTMLDRLYLQYNNGNWEVTLGRQRINWGINTVWNPNDIWNAFDFTDFDYEERPGSDALLVKRYFGFASSLEAGIRMADRLEESTFALLGKFNKWQYDFQFLAGYWKTFAVGGFGYAGNIGNAGFKGELSYFFATRDSLPNRTTGIIEAVDNSFSASFGLDYSFRNSFYINLGYLYNSLGLQNVSSALLFTFQLDARNLYPYRHSLFFQWTYPFTPLLNAGMAFIYSPVTIHALFFNPTLTYSIATGWDLDLVGQISFNRDEKEGGYPSPVQSVFLRIKWSF